MRDPSPADAHAMGYDVRRRAGSWPLEQATRRARLFLIGFALFFTANLFFFALAVGHALSAVASILFLATVLIVRPYVIDRLDDHWRRKRGGLVERAVGEQLDALRYERVDPHARSAATRHGATSITSPVGPTACM